MIKLSLIVWWLLTTTSVCIAGDSTSTADYFRAIAKNCDGSGKTVALIPIDSNKLLIDSLNPGKRCFCGWFHEPIVCPKGYEMVYGPTVLTYPEQHSYNCEKMSPYTDTGYSEYAKFPVPVDTFIIINNLDTLSLDEYTYHIFKIGYMLGTIEAMSGNYKIDSLTIRKYMELLGVKSTKIDIH
jgi:hypothetical protein